jgi:hypothetical protein
VVQPTAAWLTDNTATVPNNRRRRQENTPTTEAKDLHTRLGQDGPNGLIAPGHRNRGASLPPHSQLYRPASRPTARPHPSDLGNGIWMTKTIAAPPSDALQEVDPRFFFSVTFFYRRAPENPVTAKSRKSQCFLDRDFSNKIWIQNILRTN